MTLVGRHTLFDVRADPDLRALLATAAARLLADRNARYPALIDAGKIDSPAAHAALRCASALADQWRWIADPACPPLPAFCMIAGGYFGAPSGAIAADLATAAARARQLADRTAGDEQAALLADCYEALAELQRNDVVGDTDWYRETNRALRARADADRNTMKAAA